MKNEMKSVTPDATLLETNHIVLPSHTNAIGTIFGGVLMSWIDITAAICAGRFTGCDVVTASIDVLHFLAPCRLGDVVNLKARVIYTGRTSLVVRVEAVTESRKTKNSVRCVTADLNFVALDESSRPTAVPAIDPQTATERREYKEAEERRRIILEQRKALRS